MEEGYELCEICQEHKNLRVAVELLKEAVTMHIFAMMDKTEDAYEKERVARKQLADFMEEHPEIDLSF